MGRRGVELELRVIVVTTRAALRHVSVDGDQRKAIVGRGRALLEQFAARVADAGDDHRAAIDEAHAELDSLSHG